MDALWNRRSHLSLELSVGLGPVDAMSHATPQNESELHTSRCSLKRAKDTQQATELEEKLTKMNEEIKRLNEKVGNYIEENKTLQSKIDDRTGRFSPSEDQQNVAPLAKRRRIENDLMMKFNSNYCRETIDEAFQKDTPTSQETCMKFQEEIKPSLPELLCKPIRMIRAS